MGNGSENAICATKQTNEVQSREIQHDNRKDGKRSNRRTKRRKPLKRTIERLPT